MKRFGRLVAMVGVLVLASQAYSASSPRLVFAAGNCWVTYIISPYNGDNNITSTGQVNCNINTIETDMELKVYKWTGSIWTQVAFGSSHCYGKNTCVVLAYSGHCISSTSRSYYASMRFRYPGPTYDWGPWSNSTTSVVACTV
jgi:hypothetical protein